MKKTIIIVVCIVLLLGYAFWEQKKSEKNSLSNTEKESISVESIKKETWKPVFNKEGVLIEEGENYNLSIQVPTDPQGKLVGDVKKYTEKLAQDFIVSANTMNIETSSFPWSLDFSYTTFETEKIISYLVSGYEYTGGAHGNTTLESFNYSKETMERIFVQDIVSSPESLEVFSALADKILVVENPEGSFAQMENWDIWYANDDKVFFVFPPYQIASYAVGQQEFGVVTTGDNASLFNQEYF